MNPRRQAIRQQASGTRAKPSRRGTSEFAAILAKLDAVLQEQHELRRMVNRLTLPVEVVNIAEAARRIARSTRTVKSLVARGIFSDGRAPETRVRGADLVFFADEIEVYRIEGERGVKRLREQLGRN